MPRGFADSLKVFYGAVSCHKRGGKLVACPADSTPDMLFALTVELKLPAKELPLKCIYRTRQFMYGLTASEDFKVWYSALDYTAFQQP